jgi:hypothetical protein
LLNLLHLDWIARGPPLWEALPEAPGPETVVMKQLYCLVGIDAVGATAVGDDLPVLGEDRRGRFQEFQFHVLCE